MTDHPTPLPDGPGDAPAAKPAPEPFAFAPALPGQVATGELVESAWGNSVATWVTRLAAESVAVPSVILGSGNSDSSVATLTDWLVVALTVPTWAKTATVSTSITGIFETTQANAPYTMRLRLGTLYGYAATGCPLGVNQRFTTGWHDAITLTTTGATQIAVQCAHGAGGNLRFDNQSRAVFLVNFYGG